MANTSSNVYTALAPSRKGTYKQPPLCLKLRRLWHPQEVTRLSYRLCVLSWLILALSICPFWVFLRSFKKHLNFACCCFFKNKPFVLFDFSKQKHCGKVTALHFRGLKAKLVRQVGKTYISASKELICHFFFKSSLNLIIRKLSSRSEMPPWSQICWKLSPLITLYFI